MPREHLNEGYDCWCKPALLVNCTECEGEGCWHCGWTGDDGDISGVREITRAEADFETRPIIIVHHAVVDS